ncbi:hypothetical protein MJD09_27615 [bacterium]|nr:hypothetical protein [bacterium]
MARTNNIDFNIHDLVGIRLVNPTPGDVAAVAKQLGPMRRPIAGEPDITIRFERSLQLNDLRLLGLNSSGFTDDAYYIVYNKKAPAKVRIPFEEIGRPCEIVCESGLRAVPLLIAILNLTLLNKGYVPLHASAFVFKETGILTTGWSKGGKTEAMLSFTHNGGRYVGDEWVILSKDGEKMYGLPEPITTWDWHLEHLPNFRQMVKPGKFRLFRFIRSLEKWSQNPVVRSSPIGKVFRDAMPALKRQLHVNLSPEKLFGVNGTDLVARPDKVFFVMSHDSPEVTVMRADPQQIAKRMVASLEYEQMPIKEHYCAFKFAFPDKRNGLIEQSSALQYEILTKALAEKESYELKHPYPVLLTELYDRMRPYCEKNFKRPTQGKTEVLEAELELAGDLP